MKKIVFVALLSLGLAGCPDTAKEPTLEEKAEAKANELVNRRLGAPAAAPAPAEAEPAGAKAEEDGDAEPAGSK